MLQTPEPEMTVPNFKFVNRFIIFSPCQVWNKRLNKLSSASTKCQQCGTRQRTTDSTRQASVRLCIVHENTDLWLTAFTKEVTKLLEAKSVTLSGTAEDIEEAIMNLKNITIKYDSHKNVITEVISLQDDN